MARRTITAVACIGLASALGGCSRGSGEGAIDGDDRTYAFEDIEDFMPEDGRLEYLKKSSGTAGEIWIDQDGANVLAIYEPAECGTYSQMLGAVVASDESETADDQVLNLGGETADALWGTEGYEFASATVVIRRFDSPSSADEYLATLLRSALPCEDGFGYSVEEVEASVSIDSVEVSDVSLSGVSVVKLDHQGWVVYLPEMLPPIDHSITYVVTRGNLTLFASYNYNGDFITDADAAELIGEFVDHLG